MNLSGSQFTMRRMMTWVIIAGMMFALARYSIAKWGSEGLTHLIYWTFLVIILAPIQRRYARPAMFWAGFGGGGMLYLLFTSFGFLTLPFRLPTGLILDGIHDRLPTGITISAIDFHRAGHAFFAVVAGVLAGLFFATQARPNSTLPEPMPFRARVRANFPTVFGLWSRIWSGAKRH